MMRSSNPALSDKIFRSNSATTDGGVMTIQGTVNKTFILLGLVVLAASFTWAQARVNPGAMVGWSMVGAIGGFITAMITVFKKELAPKTAPVYAVLEGLFLGAFSSVLELQYPGVVVQAVGLTMGTLFCLLGAYKSGMIQVTDNFRLGLVAATGGIVLVYLVGFVLSLFGVSIGLITGSGPMSIAFSVFVVAIAALNLVMDFDFIERGSQAGAPQYMEWYGAFGLLVTLIWLYIEILRLLTKLRSRD